MPEHMCDTCQKTFTQKSIRDFHRQKHTSTGAPQTIASLQAEIEQCKAVLAATGALGRQEVNGGQASSTNIQVGTLHQGDVIKGDKITNIYNNLVVLPADMTLMKSFETYSPECEETRLPIPASDSGSELHLRLQLITKELRLEQLRLESKKEESRKVELEITLERERKRVV